MSVVADRVEKYLAKPVDQLTVAEHRALAAHFCRVSEAADLAARLHEEAAETARESA